MPEKKIKRRIDKYNGLSNIGIFKKKIRDKIYNIIRKVIDEYYLKRLKNYKELDFHLRALAKAKTKVAGGGARAADISDCLALYEDIINIRPKFILELGPGSSTAAICLAINSVKEKNPSYDPVFIAVESKQEWLDFHKKSIPNELISNVDLILRDEKVKNLFGQKVAYFESIPVYPYEYIHVDGPDIHGLGVNLQSDLITLENHLNENCVIVFDGRKKASRFSRKHMKGFNFRRHSKTLNHMLSKKHLKNGFLFDFLRRN